MNTYFKSTEKLTTSTQKKIASRICVGKIFGGAGAIISMKMEDIDGLKRCGGIFPLIS